MMPKYFFIRLLNRFKLLNLLNLRTTIVVNEAKVAIPLHGIIGTQHLYMTELWMIKLLQRLLQLRSGWFIDVGANLGQTLIKVKAVDGELPYLGFEPNPMCVNYTKYLIEANDYADTSIIPVGLSDQAGIFPLYMTANRVDDMATLVGKNFREEGLYVRQTFVPVIKLDNLLDLLKLEHIFMLKIDVEGGELEVLAGATKTLAQTRPFILCEILPVHDLTTEHGQLRFTRQLKLQQILKELDYTIGRLDHANISITFLETIEVHADMEYCDYLFIPIEIYSDVAALYSA